MEKKMSVEEYIENGGKLTAPENTPARYRAELMKILTIFIDSELAGASGFADMINKAPKLPAKIAASKIVYEKLYSANIMLQILASFGAKTDLYVNQSDWAFRFDRNNYIEGRQDGYDMRLNIFYSPLTNWNDAVIMNYLMGQASAIQLSELYKISYQPAAEKFTQILISETNHKNSAKKALENLILQYTITKNQDAIAELQQSVDYWYPRVAASFPKSSSPNHKKLVKFGLREENVDILLTDWRQQIHAVLKLNGLTIPD